MGQIFADHTKYSSLSKCYFKNLKVTFYIKSSMQYHHSHAQFNVQLSFPYTHSLKCFLLEGKRKWNKQKSQTKICINHQNPSNRSVQWVFKLLMTQSWLLMTLDRKPQHCVLLSFCKQHLNCLLSEWRQWNGYIKQRALANFSALM